MAIGFVFYAAYNSQVTLGIIGVFIFIMAGYENRDVQIKSSLKGGFAHMIMRTNWTRIHISDDMAKLIDIYKRGGERSFLVYDSLGYIVGGVPEAFIVDAIKNQDDYLPVVDRLTNRLAYASPDTSLLDIYQTLAQQKAAMVLIKEGEQLLGWIDKDILGRYMDSKS
jgi:predicted transcriptional regulator